MKRRLWLLLGISLISWTNYSFADDGLKGEGITKMAAFPTKVIGSIAAIGDSITAAFNAAYSEFESCEYQDTPAYSFSTNTIANTTNSIAERVIAYKGSGVATANFGQDGARMAHGDDQAQAAKTWLLNQATPRLITVFLGHNDICSGEKDKYHASCSSANRDPNNYCRTSTFAYEQQMRQMLDILITIPDSQIAIIHPIRVSQLCNFKEQKVVDEWWLTVRCKDLWNTTELFGQDGVCPSLTDCTTDRVADAYTTWAAYRDIANRLVNEYNLYGAGDTIPSNQTFGTGNIMRANNVYLLTTDVIGNAKFKYRDASGNVQLSVCECFHPSKYGQNLLAALLWNGLACSTTTPCCNDSLEGDSDYNRGLCKKYLTSGWISSLWDGLQEEKTITVDKTGTGTGVIKSNPAGIDCGSICEASFSLGSTVKVVAKPDPGSVFKGWSGSCSSTKKSCTLGIIDNQAVTAIFVSDPTIKVVPAQKNFGKVKLTKTKTIAFTIKNKIPKGKRNLLVGTITSDNAAFIIVDDFCSNTSISAKGSCKFKIRFVPSLGLTGAIVAIPSNDPEATNTVLPLIGEGIQ